MVPIQPKNKMNETETEFAWILEARKRAGEILGYVFEPAAFNLADKTKYTPDFMIVYKDRFEFIDVKARGRVRVKVSKKTGKPYKTQWTSKRDDAAVKIKVAADRFPWFRWAYWFKEADGRWIREEVGA
jgi:hypothetical protein